MTNSLLLHGSRQSGCSIYFIWSNAMQCCALSQWKQSVWERLPILLSPVQVYLSKTVLDMTIDQVYFRVHLCNCRKSCISNHYLLLIINKLVIFVKILITYIIEMALDASFIVICRIPQLVVKLVQNFLQNRTQF